MLYTSGTTGRPKGVEVPIKALAAFEAYLRLGMDLRSEDIYWNAADPGWAYGLYYAVVAPLLIGHQTILLSGPFNAELTYNVLRLMRVSNFAAAPTVYRSLRASSLNISRGDLNIRSLSSAGEPLGKNMNGWSQKNLGAAIYDHYGQTEHGMVVNNHHAPELQQALKPGAMGIAMPGFRMVVLKEGSDGEEPPKGVRGQLALDVPASPLYWFEGYYRAPDQTRERFVSGGRYYLTGDAATQDVDGYFTFSSRTDDVIIMAGYRIRAA